MIELIVGLRVLACGRQAATLDALRRVLTTAGARVEMAADPAAALSAAAGASASGDAVGLLAVEGSGANVGDLELYQRVCTLFGAPRIPMLVAGGDQSDFPGVVRVADPLDEPMLIAAVAQAIKAVEHFPPSYPPVAAPPVPVVSTDKKMRILLAEDNEVNQLVAVGMLNSLGYASEVVANGAEAVAAMAQGGFDLVLMDVRMPVMDGLEATRRIRELAGAAAGVPIIAVTANAMRGDEEACLDAGMNDYLAKPIRLMTLDATLKRWLAKK